MNDKLKGLVLGLSIGVLMTGSIAYASGSQIEVYFKNIKYMFDGQEKKPAEESFIYNGTTYVPLRFVSEALGKQVQWDGDTETVWIGRRAELNSPVAVYKGGQVTLGEFEKYMSIVNILDPQSAQLANDANYKTSTVKQMIASQILYSRLSDEDKKSAVTSADEQFSGFKDYLSKQPAGGKDWASVLASSNLTDDDLHQYFIMFVGAQKALNVSVTEDQLKNLYNQEISNKNESLLRASVRHILINFKNPDGTMRPRTEVENKLKDVQKQLNNGADFAYIAQLYSDDPGSQDNGGLYKNSPVTNWVSEFKKAALELEINKVSEPVETEFGYHIMRVEERGYLPYEQVKEAFRSRLSSSTYQRLVDTELPELIENIQFPSK
jgi:foldase protein PrsA